jgi:tRNA A-37 threonylcarbamoyl transferase component Bud32
VGASAEPSDPEIGSLIAERYRIVELLGTGGMGAVYRAEHLQLAKQVAIKLLRPEISARKDSDLRFQREALAGARLQHPNVVGVIDFGNRADGSLYLVMELLKGESLRDLLDREPRLPWPRALHIARQLLRGLGHAHAQGVIHRDLKPENVHLSNDGEDPDCAKLIDFGIAMLTAGEGSDVRITSAGLAVGTPTYLSPEQAVGGKLGPPTDLYSLSIVLYEMLAGRPPFVAEEPVRLLTAHAMTPPPSIAEVAPDVVVPPAVEAMLRRGLGKTWPERTATAADYIAMIDDARREAGIEASSSSAPRYATPMPGSLAVTPVAAGTPSPIDTEALGRAATAHGTQVPLGGATGSPAATPAPMHDAATSNVWRPSPRQLKLIAGVVGFAILLAILGAVFGGSGTTTIEGKAGGPPVFVPPVFVPSPVDRENAFKAALLDLDRGKTCPDRKKAVLRLRSLGDARAIPVLKKARYRMRGGILGLGDSNTNSCLKKDAEAAIVALGGELK